MSKVKKSLITLGIAALVLVVAGVAWIKLHPNNRDIAAREYPEFDIDFTPPPAEKNALPRLATMREENLELFEEVSTLVSEHKSSPELIAPEKYADVVDELPAIIADLSEALELGAIHSPIELSYSSSSPKLLELVKTMRIVELAIHNALNRNDIDVAIQMLELPHTCAKQVYEGNCSLVATLIGLAIESKALENTQRVVNHPEVTADQLQKVLTFKPNLHTTQLSMLRAFKGEFLAFKNAVIDIQNSVSSHKDFAIPSAHSPSSAPRNNYTFHPNRTIKRAADSYRPFIQSYDSPPHEIIKMANEFEEQVTNPPSILAPNFIGEALLAITSPIIGKQMLRTHRPLTAYRLNQALAVIRLYHLTNGELPVSLEEAYRAAGIKQLPLDPFAKEPNTPLLYSKADRKVWSVGSNFKNDNAPADTSTLSPFQNDNPNKYDYVLAIRVDEWVNK